MAKCNLIYDNNNNPIGVLDDNGERSQLFDQILANPLIKNFNQAVDVYLETKSPKIRTANENFYSNAVNALNSLKDKNVKNVQGWIKALTDVQKNGGIKNVNQELEWIGLEDYLNDYVKENNPKAGNISFDVVNDFVQSSQIEIVEVEKKSWSEGTDEAISRLENKYNITITIDENPMDGSPILDLGGEGIDDLSDDELTDLENKIKDELFTRPEFEDFTKYSGYQLKGGENYREVLLTAPKIGQEKNRQNQIDFVDSLKNKYNVNNVIDLDKVVSDEERVKWQDLTTKANTTAEKDNKYFSSHWGEPNILAHVRLNEKTLPDGRRVLILNEVQSDWQSEGRKKGFGSKQGKVYDIALGVYNARKRGDQELADRMRLEANKNSITQEEISKALTIYGDFTTPRPQGVVDMPYSNTDQYIGLVMRRVLQMATQEGYDGIALATGQQSADMYSLSKSVDYIKKTVTPMGVYIDISLPSGLVVLDVDPNTGIVLSQKGMDISNYEGKPLSDIIGKDIADKILNSPNGTKLKGEDLEVGGEGMKTFYDKIVTKVAQKEAQRFDKNIKLEEVDFSEKTNVSITEEDGGFILKVDNKFVEYVDEDTLSNANLENTSEGARKYFEKYIPQEINADKLALAKQPFIPITEAMKAEVNKGVPLFSLNAQEPQLKYQTPDGKVFSEYGDALRNTQGEDISAGVNTVDGFKELVKISSNMNLNTTEGFINHMVKADLITHKNSEGNLVPQGKTDYKQKINADSVKELFRKQFGIKSAKVNADNTISIIEENKRENVTLTKKNGEQVTVKLSELNKPFSQLKKEYDVETTATILANRVFKENASKTKDLKEEFIPETELQEKLISLIKKFGIKTLSFDEYLKNYSKRTNLPITAKALADLGNKLIAFKDGVIENDDLVEEVAHLVEASIPQEKKDNILRNIHKTEEWEQYSEQYKDVYATDAELRQEILGKVIANSIKEQFELRNNNETENSILAQIKNLFLEFISRVQAFFKESYVKELEDLNKEVFRNLMNETLDLDIKGAQVLFSNTSNASPKSSRLYNTATKVLDNLREQVKTLKNSADKALLDRAQAQLEDAEDMKAVTTMVRLASSQVEIIKKALESKGKLSPNENVVFQNIKQRLTPALSEVRAIVKDEALINEIDSIIKESSSIQGEVAKTASEDIIKMFEQVADANEFTGEDRVKYVDAMKNSLTAIQKDTDFFHAHLGSLLSARTPLLNMAGNIIERMNLQHNHYLQSTSKPFLAKVGRTALEQLYDFENGGWLMHEIDKKKEFEWEQTKKKQILEELNWESYGTKLVLPEGQTPDEYIDKSEDEKLERAYRKAWSKVNKSRYNKYFKEDYIKSMESHTMKIGDTEIDFNQISDEAKDIDASWRAQSTSIRIQAGNNITKPIQAQLREIAKKREADANPRNADGSLIEGLKEVYDQELGRYFIIFGKTSIGQLTEKQIETAKVIEGLNHLTYLKQDFFAKNNKNEGYPDTFLQALKEADNKMEFLEMNSYISFPDSFFEELKNNVGLTARLREAGEEGLEQDIREQQSIINRVLRANKVFNRPSETDFASMNITAKTEIKFAQTRLEKLYGEARTVLSDEVVDNELAIDNVVNASYFKHLEDAGIEEGSDAEVEFILENVTDNGLVAIKSAQRIVAGGRISKSFERYFSENMNTDERQQALVKYARTKLLPYLKRTEPIGYTNLINQVNSGQVSAEELLNRPDVIKISPNISFFEDTNENVNQDFIRNRDAKKEQWSKEYLAEVRNDKFYETFGINEKTGERTKNEELWQARQAILDFADQMIEFQDLTGKRSRYLMPQVRATEMERLIKLNPKMAGQAFKDWTTFRPEEQEKGAVTSDGLYMIPTYYNTPLEDSKELTKNILYAYMMWGNQASLFKARKENINDMFIVEDAISNTRFETKKAENTQTYKMFQNFMEYNFYGVRETFSAEFELGGRTFDAGKILMSLNRWAKKTNTTNIVTPVTSLLQSSTQKFMERIIGETTNHIASNEGNKLFMKLAPGAMKEVMGFDSKSELNVIGEALGMYSAVHRFEDSQFGKPMRLALNVGGKLHELGNFPVVGRALSSIISDYRFVDGRIISYNQFKKKMNVEDFKGDIDKEWTSKEMFQPHFLRAVKNGVLDFTNEEFLKGIEGKLNVEDVNKYLEDKKLSISKRALAFVQRIDSQIPQHQKAAAQRNAITNFFLSHLSWLLTAIPNKFKQAHYNLSEEGAQQEGSWRTTAKFLNKIVFNPKKAMEVYGSLTDNEKKNLRRTLVELGFANALALTAILLARYNDDDDDPNYLLSVADMFTTRLANEQISSTVGIPSGIYGVFDNPLLLKSKMEDWVKINKLVGTPEERSSYLGKVLPFYKDFGKFSDPLDTRKKYVHFQTKDESLFYNTAWLSRFLKKD